MNNFHLNFKIPVWHFLIVMILQKKMCVCVCVRAGGSWEEIPATLWFEVAYSSVYVGILTDVL